MHESWTITGKLWIINRVIFRSYLASSQDSTLHAQCLVSLHLYSQVYMSHECATPTPILLQLWHWCDFQDPPLDTDALTFWSKGLSQIQHLGSASLLQTAQTVVYNLEFPQFPEGVASSQAWFFVCTTQWTCMVKQKMSVAGAGLG